MLEGVRGLDGDLTYGLRNGCTSNSFVIHPGRWSRDPVIDQLVSGVTWTPLGRQPLGARNLLIANGHYLRWNPWWKRPELIDARLTLKKCRIEEWWGSCTNLTSESRKIMQLSQASWIQVTGPSIWAVAAKHPCWLMIWHLIGILASFISATYMVSTTKHLGI
jgi:hypothetical protein